jgi:radical SAM protein with 4Fe4S-binding SPASM domain
MIEPPFLVSYAITRKCNLKCKHCYSDATETAAPDELTLTEAKKLLDDLAGWGIKLLILDGGEPLCRDDFLEIASYASNKGMRVVVGSNGTLIDSQTAEKMKEAGVREVAISVDGATAKTHDEFRGEDGTFNKTLAGAKACKEAGLPFQFNTIIRKTTLPEIPEILNLAIKSGANAAEFFDIIQVSRVKERCAEEILSKDERKEIMTWLAETQEDSPILIRVPACPMYPLLLKEKNIQPKRFSPQLLHSVPYYHGGCAAGMPRGYITILPNGDLIPCMLLQINLGNIREKSVLKIWEESPILAKLRSRELLEGACGECVYRDTCAGCRGRAYEETGNMMATDPGCWLVK